MPKRKKYVQVGVGGRSWFYTEAIVRHMRAECELVGICDSNRGRLELRNREIEERFKVPPVPAYPASAFDRMIAERKPDVVVVTTMDAAHDRYVVRAMELGCDVVCEKPMTTTPEKCQRIVDAVRKTGREIKVTFNCRYMPPMEQVKALLMRGAVGRILSVDLRWMLNLSHGADYFRRWHAEKKNSGGLLIHKASHHFDLVNWFLSASPTGVYAMGAQSFYGARSGVPEKLGLQKRAARCLDCASRKTCKFYFDLRKSPGLRAMYLENEKYDGYVRDQCVFGRRIDIEDTMNLVVRYDSGAFLSYSLNAFTPWEGFHFAFNGTRGRLEFDDIGGSVGGGGKAPASIPLGKSIRVYPHFKPAFSVPVTAGRGSHGGGDAAIMKGLFAARPPRDPLMRAADYASGAMSILIGAAANISMRQDRPVSIDRLVRGLPKPELPPMPE